MAIMLSDNGVDGSKLVVAGYLMGIIVERLHIADKTSNNSNKYSCGGEKVGKRWCDIID